MNNLLIQVISIILSFICGVTFAWLYLRRTSHTPSAPTALTPSPMPSVVVMPEEVKSQLLNDTRHDYEAALDKSAAVFERDLTATSDKINHQITDLSANVISTELEEYRTGLIKLREEALSEMGAIQKAVQEQRGQMMAQLETEIKTEKTRRLSQIDTKLGDAVGAFLVEVLQHNVDLGAQTPYLLAMLEEHKAELKQEVDHDV